VIHEQAREITMRHVTRPPVLGVDPRLILVFELGGPVDLAEFRLAGLIVLDGSDRHVVVAFADDPALVSFHERLDAMRGGVPEGQKNEPHAAFFDAIDSLRTLDASDRLTDAVRVAIEMTDGAELLRIDIECWHPEDREIAAGWLTELEEAVTRIDGRVVDRYVHDGAGLLLARAYVPASRVVELAELDFVARIDVLPRAALSLPQLYGDELVDMPEGPAPAANAPIVGVVDSGVRSAHPLLAGVVVAADPVGTGITEGEDQHGHGTMVAALIAHGSIEGVITRDVRVPPICRIVSARVLDANNEFADDDLWEHDLEDAVRWCIDQGASIVNVSLGNSSAVLSSSRQLAGAAILDDLARTHDVTIVTCTGNIAPADYLTDIVDGTALEYPSRLLAAPHARLIDPASAMLALTVGAVTDAAAASGMTARENVVRVVMGKPGWPSPFTRIGPGLSGAVKPELVERGGTLGIESGRLVENDAELGVISAGAKVDRLLMQDLGTSFAAPLVARVAAAVKSRFPEFSANQVRALVLASTVPPEFADHLEGGTPAERQNAVRRLMGYGRPSIGRAIESTSHRVVLVAEDDVPVDGVHIYEIPVPSSFQEPGGQRGIDVALAFDPRTRARRLDYMSSRMDFHLFRGMSVDAIFESVARLDPADEYDIEALSQEEEELTPEDAATPSAPPTVSQLGAKVSKLLPATTIRSAGANQLGRKVFSQRFGDDHLPMHLVVRNTNRWDDSSASQSYALAVVLWRTEGHDEIHAELEASLEAVVEVDVEIELEVEA
jgi:subtilisin family serine protease